MKLLTNKIWRSAFRDATNDYELGKYLEVCFYIQIPNKVTIIKWCGAWDNTMMNNIRLHRNNLSLVLDQQI